MPVLFSIIIGVRRSRRTPGIYVLCIFGCRVTGLLFGYLLWFVIRIQGGKSTKRKAKLKEMSEKKT